MLCSKMVAISKREFFSPCRYVGLDDATGTELFYYFVESERSPATDALILWLSGGPRCSVLCGLALEIGPIKFVLKPYDGTLPDLALNPNSWTQVRGLFRSFLMKPTPWSNNQPLTILRCRAFSSWTRPSVLDSRSRAIRKDTTLEIYRLPCSWWHFSGRFGGARPFVSQEKGSYFSCWLFFFCLCLHSGSKITHSTFRIRSTSVEIHMPGRWFLLSHTTFQKVWTVSNLGWLFFLGHACLCIAWFLFFFGQNIAWFPLAINIHF